MKLYVKKLIMLSDVNSPIKSKLEKIVRKIENMMLVFRMDLLKGRKRFIINRIGLVISINSF